MPSLTLVLVAVIVLGGIAVYFLNHNCHSEKADVEEDEWWRSIK